jgi:hypothetical protein
VNKKQNNTNNYKTILISRKPLLYFPDDYNASISTTGTVEDEKLNEEIQKWNSDYYELLEYRKNPPLGRMKCSKCLLSGSNDDPIFIGIEKVFARIVTDHCNNNNAANSHADGIITYHCNVMNIFSCPFESKESYNEIEEIESKSPYKREDLFALHQLSFAIEQAITTFFEITKNNEIIYEVDFENDRVQEIHTKYNGEPESWGWQKNVTEQLSKVKPISNIKIKEEKDIYNILTNKEKLESLLQEYEKKNNYHLNKEQQVCCDEITPCVLDKKYNSNNEKASTTTTETLDATGEKNQQLQQQVQIRQDKQNDSHKAENRHSKKTEGEEVDNENLKINLKTKIKDELEKSDKEQQILLKQNKQKIIDFLLDNTDSIRIEDLKIYEPIYKCYRQKGNCQMCNNLSNIVCVNCNDSNELWLCTNHWQNHAIYKHE